MTRDTGSVDGAAIAAAKFDASGWGHHRSAVTDACAIVAFVPCACSSPSVSAEDGLWTGAETCWTSSDASLVPGLGNRTVWSRALSSRSASAFNAARHSRFPPWFAPPSVASPQYRQVMHGERQPAGQNRDPHFYASNYAPAVYC